MSANHGSGSSKPFAKFLGAYVVFFLHKIHGLYVTSSIVTNCVVHMRRSSKWFVFWKKNIYDANFAWEILYQFFLEIFLETQKKVGICHCHWLEPVRSVVIVFPLSRSEFNLHFLRGAFSEGLFTSASLCVERKQFVGPMWKNMWIFCWETFQKLFGGNSLVVENSGSRLSIQVRVQYDS